MSKRREETDAIALNKSDHEKVTGHQMQTELSYIDCPFEPEFQTVRAKLVEASFSPESPGTNDQLQPSDSKVEDGIFEQARRKFFSK
jgi:hypothetical protein